MLRENPEHLLNVLRMKYKNHYLTIIYILLWSSLFSQVDSIVWQQCYGTTNYYSNYIEGLVRYNNGYLFSVAINQEESWISNFHGSADAWLVQTDSLGNITWEKCYGGSEGDGLTKIIPIDSNYVYLYGGTSSTDGDVHNFTNENQDNWIIKINKYGDIIWENCYGGPGVDETRDAILTPDGGLIFMSRIYAAGGDISEHFGSLDIWLCRIDSVGNLLWEKTLGNHKMENAITMEYASDTSFFVLGGVNEIGGMVDCDCNEHPTGHLDVWLVEMDLNGNLLSQNCYGGTGNEIVSDIVKVDDGFVFASLTTSNDGDVSGFHGIPWDNSTDDIWVCKIDFAGNIIWQNCIGGTFSEWPRNITQTQDSGFIVIGNTSSYDGDVNTNHATSGSGVKDAWVVKLNSVGEIEWEHCYGGMGRDYIVSSHNIVKINDYNYVLGIQANGISGDVECTLNSSIWDPGDDAWVINIKDCSHFAPQQPQQPTGKDTLCVNTDNITTYSTVHANNAWYYEWHLQPEDAGTPSQDSLHTTIHWNTTYEGPATLKVRSTNDCGESTWSDSLVIQTYMCLGTNENNFAANLRVYPNPASSRLIVEMENNTMKSYNIEVYNSFGSKVYSVEAMNKNTSINVSGWNSGIYVVNLLSGSRSFNRKVIVK